MTGGSGRASVESPTRLIVAEDGSMTATVTWSSSHYDLMAVDGVDYRPITTEGNASFEIPVPALDEDIDVQAETTAMSVPHTIDYTLRFDADSLKRTSAAEPSSRAVVAAVVAAVAATVMILLVVRGRRHEGGRQA